MAQNGVLCKTGALTRRYLGTFYCTTAGNGQIEDSVANRYLWNYYNRVARPMRAIDATASWNYTTATIRQANGAAANQLNFVIGVSEDIVSARVQSTKANSSAGIDGVVGIALDSTSTFTATGSFCNVSGPANGRVNLTAALDVYPGVGKHYLSWNEYSAASGTTTWYGTQVVNLSGIYGVLMG